MIPASSKKQAEWAHRATGASFNRFQLQVSAHGNADMRFMCATGKNALLHICCASDGRTHATDESSLSACCGHKVRVAVAELSVLRYYCSLLLKPCVYSSVGLSLAVPVLREKRS